MTRSSAVVAAARRTARRGAGTVLGSAVAVRTAAPQIVLTFDDGPEPGGTDRVLSALGAAGATATFFMLLTRVRRYPELCAEVLAAGHEVALHGEDHRALPSLPAEEVARRLRDGKAELEDVTGRPIRWCRPPYGRQTVRNWRSARTAGLLPVLWGPTTWDWRDIPQADRLDKAVQGIGPGAIVLAHDGFASADDGAFDGPAPALDRGALVSAVLERYADRGLAASSLGGALAHGALVRETWFSR